MIATVVFFTEEGVLKGVLVSDVQTAVVCEGMRQVFVRARARLEVVEFVSSEGGGA